MKRFFKFIFVFMFMFAGAFTFSACSEKGEVEFLSMGIVAADKSNTAGTGSNIADDGNIFSPADNSAIELADYQVYIGQSLKLVVWLSNPEQFEILSFTLNGYKYQSYQFQDGSNSEKIIVLLEEAIGTDLEAGMHEYSIDAIKYINKQATKEAKMTGKKTIKVKVSQGSQNPDDKDDEDNGGDEDDDDKDKPTASFPAGTYESTTAAYIFFTAPEDGYVTFNVVSYERTEASYIYYVALFSNETIDWDYLIQDTSAMSNFGSIIGHVMQVEEGKEYYLGIKPYSMYLQTITFNITFTPYDAK